MDLSALRYTKTHEWAHLADGVCTVGITPFAADQLQDITYIKLPTVGAKVSADASFGEVETVKAVSDFYAPVDGEVIAVNSTVAETPDLLKNDPLGQGWIAKIRLAAGANLSHLMDAVSYQKQIDSEPH
jgi:glycine cleavage system H protein